MQQVPSGPQIALKPRHHRMDVDTVACYTRPGAASSSQTAAIGFCIAVLFFWENVAGTASSNLGKLLEKAPPLSHPFLFLSQGQLGWAGNMDQPSASA